MYRKLGLLVLVIALAAFYNGCGEHQAEAEKVEEKVPVKVTTVARGDVTQTVTYSGDVKAEYEIKVFSKIPDRIVELYVDEGDYVQQGQKIARVLAATIGQAVRQAEAALAAARAQEANLQMEYERAQRLARENAMSQQQFDAVKTQYEAVQAQVQQAEAVLASAKSQFTDATITAPISGIIGKRFYEVGDMAAPQLPVVTIVQMDRVKITFEVSDRDYGQLRIGQPATISVRSFPDKTFDGKISKISPVLDPITRLATVEVLIDNKNGELKPGMFGEVTVITGVLKDMLSVPRYATIETTVLERVEGKDRVGKKYAVYVIENGKAVRRELDVNYVNHQRIAVNSGISEGELLVVEGQNNLRDSMAVSIIEEDAAL